MSEEWYCKRKNIVRGPFSKEAIIQLIHRKKILIDDEVRNGTEEVWVEAGKVFAEAFKTEKESEPNNATSNIPAGIMNIVGKIQDAHRNESGGKYPTLKILTAIYYVSAGIIAFIFALLLCFGIIVMAKEFLPGLAFVFGIIIVCPMLVIALVSTAEAIQLFMDIESTLREIRDRLPKS